VALIVLAVGWLAGIGLGLGVGAQVAAAGIAALAGGALAALWWPVRPARLLCFAIIAGALGLLRAGTGESGFAPSDVGYYAGQTVTVVGVVAEDPDRRESGILFRLRAEHLAIDQRVIAVTGDILVHGRLEARYGDRLTLAGRLERPQDTDDIPYARFLAGQGLFVVMRQARLVATGANEGWPPLVALYRVKSSLSSSLARALPEPEAGLARGMLLGERGGMSSALRVAFNRTNTTHIVAISGYNVSLVAGALLFVGGLAGRSRGGRRAGLLFAATGVVAFLFLVGPTDASVQRAVVMGILALTAQALHRRGDALVGLAVAAIAMTALRPLAIADLGFQLSFLATLALISFATWLTRPFSSLPSALAAAIGATLAAELAVLPLLSATFHQISVVTLVANFLVIPAVPLAMIFGSLAAVVGALVPAISAPFGWLAWVSYHWIIAAVEWCASVPFATVAIGRMGGPLVVVYYLGLAALWLASPGSPFPNPYPRIATALAPIGGRVPARVGLILLLTIAAVTVAGALSTRDALRVTVFDIGDAALVQSSEGRNVLIVGDRANGLSEALGRALPFWDKRIDLLYVTASNANTGASVDAILDRYEVGAVLLPPGMAEEDEDEDDAGRSAARSATAARISRDLRRGLARRQVTVFSVRPDDLVDLRDGTTLRIAASEDGGDAALQLIRGDAGVLFVGQRNEAEIRRWLERGGDLRATVVVVPLGSLSEDLTPIILAAAEPEAIIATSPASTIRQERPSSSLSDVPIFLTRERGSITIEFATSGVRLQAQR
jgi:competence protein ComEC